MPAFAPISAGHYRRVPHSASACLCGRLLLVFVFLFDYFDALVVSAAWANLVRHARRLAVRALYQVRQRDGVVRAAAMRAAMRETTFR